MTTSGECTDCLDERRLVRDGTSQDQRAPAALDPAFAPIDEHGPANRIVFARALSAFVRYFDANDVAAGDWQRFFDRDVSAQIAVAVIANVSEYRSTIKGLMDQLANPAGPDPEHARVLGSVFSAVGSLARQLDGLKEALPAEHPLRAALTNSIRTQLAPAMKRLIGYDKAGRTLGVVQDAVPSPNLRILGGFVTTFTSVLAAGLSTDWISNSTAAGWADYDNGIGADATVYGPGPAGADRVNHLATHNLFTSILAVFLRGYARAVADAQTALDATFGQANHEPHYALFLAFVRLLEHARAGANTLTALHLDFYYRQILRLQERPAVPGNVHLLVELAKQVGSHALPAGTGFKAGKDDLGIDVVFDADGDLVANRAGVVERRTVYRHHQGPNESLPFQDGRIFASPVADSDDGRGAPLAGPHPSWHPFFNKTFENGVLTAIRMPPADVGFAIASHQLWMAEGARTITVDIATIGGGPLPDLGPATTCLLTSEKGWLEKAATSFTRVPGGPIRLTIGLTGGDPAITPYVAATHKLTFSTGLPILLVKLRHLPDAPWTYPLLQDLVVSKIDLRVKVEGLRTLALSNDFGPVDASKPFQPYGPAPIASSAFIVGSKEAFGKHLTAATLKVDWMTTPSPYTTSPKVGIDVLLQGQWAPSPVPPVNVTATSYNLVGSTGLPEVDAPDLTPDEPYTTSSRHGFARLRISDGFGQDAYAIALVDSIVSKIGSAAGADKPAGFASQAMVVVTKPIENATPIDETAKVAVIKGAGRPRPPVIPTIRALTLGYEATQTIALDPAPSAAGAGGARFFHVGPFGHAEQHPVTTGTRRVMLLPQFTLDDGSTAEGELYLGIAGLAPPQNLALLVQVVDGTANPLTAKPPAHVHWSYLRDNEWVGFAAAAVDDRTGGLLDSGIVTLAVPDDASDDNTILPGGLHWVRGVVHTASDAVCRLSLVAAQAVKATYAENGNDPAFPAKPLPPGTISKLAEPDAAVKSIGQPFPGFGGRAAESPAAFATRVSERLRHKDRAIALWDYERLILEAFPSIYRVQCLNHTRYEPNDAGTGVYRELAPGHVTVVTIPVQQAGDRRDPLRPFTSLGVLARIQAFLAARLPCFVTLHVRNPQFEEVHVDFRVRLRDGSDETFAVNRLREEITRFLSPWAFAGGVGPTFSGRFYKSVLIDFVEERPYVDYVTDFRLFHRYFARSASGAVVEVVSPDADEVTGSSAVSILVSVPAVKHVISVIHPDEDELPPDDCLCEVSIS